MNARGRRQARREVDRLCDEVQQARLVAGQHREALDALRVHAAELEAQRDAVAWDAADCAGALAQAAAKLDELEAILGTALAESVRRLGRISILRDELSELRREHATALEVIAVQEERLRVFEERDAEVGRVLAQDHDATRLRRRLAQRGAELACATARVSELTALVNRLRAELPVHLQMTVRPRPR